MIRPTLNPNGSSAFDLINPRRNAMALIDEVIDALKQATPNGRDYPGNNTACLADREAHYDRIAIIKRLREDIYAEAIAIKQQEQDA